MGELLKLNTYVPTCLEKLVIKFYQKIKVYHSHELDENSLASRLGIYLTYSDKACYSYESGKLKIINLDKNLPKKVSRERFFHEIAHVLRHAGYQLKMPKMFMDYQEWDAANFTRYAALPYHILKNYDLTQDNIIEQLSDDFCVTEKLCYERLEQIKRRKVLNDYNKKYNIMAIKG